MKGNAKIISTSLGYEDHGILSCWITLEQSGVQGFGGYCLDNKPARDNKGHCYGDRLPSKLCGFWIKRILEIAGVDTWEKLIGQYVRVDGEDWGKIIGIGHIIKDNWFYPEKEIKKFIDE